MAGNRGPAEIAGTKTAIDLAGAVISTELQAREGPLRASTLTSCITQTLELCLLLCSEEGITFPRRNFFVLPFALSLNWRRKKKKEKTWEFGALLKQAVQRGCHCLVSLFRTSFRTRKSSRVGSCP